MFKWLVNKIKKIQKRTALYYTKKYLDATATGFFVKNNGKLPEEYNKYFEEAAETYNKIYGIQKDLSNLSKNLEALAGQLNYILAFRL